MKTLLLFLVATATILGSTFAQAKSVLLPSFPVKIYNHTSVPNEQIQVRAEISCSYKSGFVWPESKGCGNEVHNLTVAADGIVIVPNLNWQQKSGINKYNLSFSVSSKKFNSLLSTLFVSFDGKEIKKAPSTLKEVSLYEMPSVKINVTTPNGEDYASWRGVINNPYGASKKPCVELIYLVKIEGTEYSFNGFSSSRAHLTDEAVAGVIPNIAFGIKGNPGPHLNVSGSLYYSTAKPACESNHTVVKHDQMVEFQGDISEVHKYFNNSSYKVD